MYLTVQTIPAAAYYCTSDMSGQNVKKKKKTPLKRSCTHVIIKHHVIFRFTYQWTGSISAVRGFFFGLLKTLLEKNHREMHFWTSETLRMLTCVTILMLCERWLSVEMFVFVWVPSVKYAHTLVYQYRSTLPRKPWCHTHHK